MKDPIKDLIKESRLETSTWFTQKTMDELDRRIQQKMKRRLYLLIIAVVLLFVVAAYALASAGFKINAFGLLIPLPKLLTMVFISLVSYICILHLFLLLNFGSFKAQGR